MEVTVTREQEAIIVTRERIRLLAIGYYISGGLGVIFASFFLLYVLMLGAMSFMPFAAMESSQKTERTAKGEPAHKASAAESSAKKISQEEARVTALVMRIASGVMGFFVLIGWTLAGLTIYAGYCLQKRKHKVLILAMAIVNLMWIPYGTLLGVATLLTLQSDAGGAEFWT